MAEQTKPQTVVPDRAASGEPGVYDDGYLRVEHDNFYIACGGRSIALSRKEFLILSRLAQKVDRVVTSQEIWKYAWGDAAEFNARSLRVHIHRLRHALGPMGININRMVGVGYRLSPVRANGDAGRDE